MDKRGSVLMISMWILAILVIFSLGLGQRALISLRLARYQKDSLKAEYLAKAGIYRAIEELEKDQENDAKNPPGYDSLDEIWSSGRDIQGKPILEDETPQEDYGGTFTIRYLYDNYTREYRCMQDEESKIDINQGGDYGKQLLTLLFSSAGISQTEAQELAALVAEWTDSGQKTGSGTENFKNSKFKANEELVAVLEYYYEPKYGRENFRQRAQEVYDKIKGLITVYSDAKINLNTASQEVLVITAQANSPNQDVQKSAGTLANKIIQFRSGSDGPFTLNTVQTFREKSEMTQDEQTIFNNMGPNTVFQSSNFRIQATGKFGTAIKQISAVYKRADKDIIYWHEN
jgi:type II secretory pathway component PulK